MNHVTLSDWTSCRESVVEDVVDGATDSIVQSGGIAFVIIP